MVQSLTDGGYAGAHGGRVFETHPLGDLGQVSVFDHGVFGVGTIFEVLLFGLGSEQMERKHGRKE